MYNVYICNANPVQGRDIVLTIASYQEEEGHRRGGVVCLSCAGCQVHIYSTSIHGQRETQHT